MTKDVLVSISGLQMAANDVENQDEPIEVLTPGSYFFKDGKHYIFFEEVTEGIPGVTKSQIRIQGKESLEVIKKGVSNMHMIFDKKAKTHCRYKTPFGQLNLGIVTTSVWVEEKEENINIKVEYFLDVDYEPLAECTIRINIKPRDAKDFSILETMDF